MVTIRETLKSCGIEENSCIAKCCDALALLVEKIGAVLTDLWNQIVAWCQPSAALPQLAHRVTAPSEVPKELIFTTFSTVHCPAAAPFPKREPNASVERFSFDRLHQLVLSPSENRYEVGDYIRRFADQITMEDFVRLLNSTRSPLVHQYTGSLGELRWDIGRSLEQNPSINNRIALIEGIVYWIREKTPQESAPDNTHPFFPLFEALYHLRVNLGGKQECSLADLEEVNAFWPREVETNYQTLRKNLLLAQEQLRLLPLITALVQEEVTVTFPNSPTTCNYPLATDYLRHFPALRQYLKVGDEIARIETFDPQSYFDNLWNGFQDAQRRGDLERFFIALLHERAFKKYLFDFSPLQPFCLSPDTEGEGYADNPLDFHRVYVNRLLAEEAPRFGMTFEGFKQRVEAWMTGPQEVEDRVVIEFINKHCTKEAFRKWFEGAEARTSSLQPGEWDQRSYEEGCMLAYERRFTQTRFAEFIKIKGISESDFKGQIKRAEQANQTDALVDEFLDSISSERYEKWLVANQGKRVALMEVEEGFYPPSYRVGGLIKACRDLDIP